MEWISTAPQASPAGLSPRQGSSSHRGPLLRRGTLLGVTVAVAAVLVTGCSRAEPPVVANTYGGMPSYLAGASGAASRDADSRTDGVLSGSAAKPALTSEGDSVRVRLADGTRVVATVTGPVVPGEGLPDQGETTTCTWTVALSGATASVPIDIDRMTTTDQLGNVYRLSAVAGQPAPPATLAPGERASFQLRTVMKVGEGLLRWSPDGEHTVAAWDFEVEND